MTYKKTEKEIIKAIVKYGGQVNSLAKVINKSQLLENRGIVIAFASDCNYVFLDKQKYEWDDKRALSYLNEFTSLIQHLIDERYITILNKNERGPLVLGRKQAKWAKPGWIAVGDAMLYVEDNMGGWRDRNGEQTYWPNCYPEQQLPISHYLDCWFSVSQDLKNLVKNDFMSEDQIRFAKQQRLTWISIAVTGLIGLAGLIIAIIGLLIC
jgi:hypothetical protein